MGQSGTIHIHRSFSGPSGFPRQESDVHYSDEALVIMVIVASTTEPKTLAFLRGCFCALIGYLVGGVLILDEKAIESLSNQCS